MDPDANFRERIAILRRRGATPTQPVTRRSLGRIDGTRFDELTEAYAEWRAKDGFVASRELRDELLTLYGVKK